MACMWEIGVAMRQMTNAGDDVSDEAIDGPGLGTRFIPSLLKSLSAILVSGMPINQLEYFLQGSIEEKSVNTLLDRLKGLCDNAPERQGKFSESESVFNLGTGSNSVTLRARQFKGDSPSSWQLCYLGQAEMGDKSRCTLLRSCVEVCTSDNVSRFLQELGFSLDYAFGIEGYYFFKGHMRITVSKVLRPRDKAVSDAYLVEISLATPVQQDSVAEEVKAFAEHLKPLVHLEKIDHRKLQTT